LTDPLLTQAQALPADWRAMTLEFLRSREGAALREFLAARRADNATVFPPRPLHAFELTPFAAIRVVILGQDPYHGAGQAQGLAFSVAQGVRLPPSLRNILQEISSDLGLAPPRSGDLSAWARQGVLLLNTVLTVEEGRPASHARRGWEMFTDHVIAALARDAAPKVFLLWGLHAQAKAAMIESVGTNHCVLRANHPSPLSARRPPVPFLGCRHFSRANAFLVENGRPPIDWRLW
jgi:uracil-DNA glycosylase